MAELVKVRRLSDEEGQRLLQIVRRGEPKMTKSVIRYRRAMVVLASASGNTVPAIARLVAADRVISTVDPDARHAHKTVHRRTDGFTAHVVVEPDTGLITATRLTAGG